MTRNRNPLLGALAATLMLLVQACSDSDPATATVPPADTGGTQPPASTPGPGQVVGVADAAGADLTAIAARVDAVLALGYNTTNPDVLAKQLFGRDANAPASAVFVLDTREPADFAAGHVPGAVNIPLTQLPRTLLENPGAIPPAKGEGAKDVVVASYFGGDGNMAVLLINAVRITDPAAQKAAADAKQPLPFKKATGLFAGMASWSFKRELTPRPGGGNYRFYGDANARPLDKTAVATSPQKLPAFAAFGTDDVSRMILIRAREYLATVASQHDLQIDDQQLAAMLADPQVASGIQLLSVRAPADYAKAGHLPGAVNIPWQQVAKLANAKVLDPTKQVIAYCYTGHTGGQATMALGILGYPARNFLYGISGWNMAASNLALKSFDLQKGWDFPLHNTGSGIATLATHDPRPATCLGCHTSLTAIAYDMWVKAPATAAAPPSEGEG